MSDQYSKYLLILINVCVAQIGCKRFTADLFLYRIILSAIRLACRCTQLIAVNSIIFLYLFKKNLQDY